MPNQFGKLGEAKDLVLVDKITGEVRYKNLTFRYPSRAAERQAHKRWKKMGWSDEKIRDFEEYFDIKLVQ